MAVDSETITAALSAAFPELYVEVNVREGSCGAFVDLVVVSPGFEGVAPLARQRSVQEALKGLMAGIHALSMKTWTPAQWEKKKEAAKAPVTADAPPLPSSE